MKTAKLSGAAARAWAMAQARAGRVGYAKMGGDRLARWGADSEFTRQEGRIAECGFCGRAAYAAMKYGAASE